MHAAVVDPGDAKPVLEALDANGLTLVAILLTHHHADHIGGVPELLRHVSVPVFGPANDGIAVVTQPLSQGDIVSLPELALALEVLDVPGHTRGHIAFHAPRQHWLFCGDTLFAGGCGRLFEGTPTQLNDSLQKLAALPGQTEVYCAHEYTMANLRFALEVEPDNPALIDRIATEQKKRDIGQPTVPSTIAIERATNPFLRTHSPTIVSRLRHAGRLDSDAGVAAFAALRSWKNTFA
ncbi:hydroxyacylglutathione hydrolase [Actimicrobium antarcticum]|uniref:Hydroxyacylglutathione hydrolase n=2 Tax=Actimicrobium antarcticum TaxID=1051899 RepID=A0ABP7SPJ1_9BURK